LLWNFWSSYAITVIIYLITKNFFENIIKWLEKIKKLRNHMISVYEYHIKNSSDFDKELLNIPHKDTLAHIVLHS
jgi:coproporphyrinogen III oxidase-like Fe-S oxidoreductase